jgi:hypothetical protein
MRRILYYSLLCLLWVSVNSCQDDEASQPPTPSFTVDKTTGLYQSTEFAFTVDQVGSNAVSLLPYGADHVNDAGILIPASSFVDGKATVKFTYGKVGTFNAVVVSNNHTGDGLSIKNAVSSPTAITITSDQTALTDFSFEKSTKTVINADLHTIAVTQAYTLDHLSALKAKYTASDFSTVTVGSATQKSGETVNNFNAPVVYTVKSQDGLKSTNWTVTVTETPVETDNTFKSASAIVAKKDHPVNGRVLPGSIDNVGRTIVFYDTIGRHKDNFSALAFDYALKGGFAYAKYPVTNKKVHGKDTLDLTSSKQVIVVAQDSSTATYTLHQAEAPKLNLSFGAPLSPSVTGSTTNFDVTLKVLNGTNVSTLITTYSLDVPAGTTTGVVTADGTPVVSGVTPIDYTDPVKFEIPVTQDGVTFTVVFTATVTVLK